MSSDCSPNMQKVIMKMRHKQKSFTHYFCCANGLMLIKHYVGKRQTEDHSPPIKILFCPGLCPLPQQTTPCLHGLSSTRCCATKRDLVFPPPVCLTDGLTRLLGYRLGVGPGHASFRQVRPERQCRLRCPQSVLAVC